MHSGKVMTVLGPVDPSTLGPTLTHEHLLLEFTNMGELPAEASRVFFARGPITPENMAWHRRNRYASLEARTFTDENMAISEAMHFKLAGGGTICDVTPVGIGRDPLGLARISRATGLNIVMGAGYYRERTHPEYVDGMTEDDIADQLVTEVRDGVGDTGVRPGLFGEIGSGWPITRNELKVLRAAAAAQAETGAPMLIHPGWEDDHAPHKILDILDEAGGDVSRTIMGHLDRTVFKYSILKELAETGCYLEYDVFGTDSNYYPVESELDMPGDAQRMDFIEMLTADGYGDRIVIAHDICTKDRTVKHGGHGLGHILENLVPRMRKRGWPDEHIDAILTDNPARALTYA